MTAACGSSTTSTPNKPATSLPPTAASSPATPPAAPANAPESTEGKQDFTLVNATGVEIDKVYIAPHSSDDWEEDILGQDTLATGDSVSITFSPREKPKMWDIKIVDKAGGSLVWENLNLLEISEVTLYFKDGKAWADVK